MNKHFDGYNDLHNTYSAKHHVPHMKPGYKGKWLESQKNGRVLLWTIGILLVLDFVLVIGCNYRTDSLRAEISRLNGQLDISYDLLSKYEDNEKYLIDSVATCSAKKSVGKVSYYSKDGCLGCSTNQRMANGEIFDETKYTLAHNSIPLNTIVMVKNLDNGKQMTAKVTDRGGFGKYNRIADLSKALYDDLGVRTDKSIIEISY